MQEKRKTTQARNAVHQICISHSVWWAGLTIFFDQWILGTSGGKLKARLLASSPNRWLLGRSHRLRHEACEVSAAIRTVTGRRCRGPSCGPRSKGTGRWVGGRAHLLDKQPRLILLPLLGAFLSMSGLHNENMALWNGLFFWHKKIIFLIPQIKTFTHSKISIGRGAPEVLICAVNHKNSQQLPRTLYWVVRTSLPRNSTSVITPQTKLGGFRSSSLIPWRIRFIWPTFGIPRSRL